MSESEVRACLDKLENIKFDMEEILNKIGDKQRLIGIEKRRVQQLLKVFKKNLNDEFRRLSTHRGQANLNQIEKKYYLWAVAEAHESVRIKFNSVPDLRWRSDLEEAASEIGYYVDHLRLQLQV